MGTACGGVRSRRRGAPRRCRDDESVRAGACRCPARRTAVEPARARDDAGWHVPGPSRTGASPGIPRRPRDRGRSDRPHGLGPGARAIAVVPGTAGDVRRARGVADSRVAAAAHRRDDRVPRSPRRTRGTQESVFDHLPEHLRKRGPLWRRPRCQRPGSIRLSVSAAQPVDGGTGVSPRRGRPLRGARGARGRGRVHWILRPGPHRAAGGRRASVHAADLLRARAGVDRITRHLLGRIDSLRGNESACHAPDCRPRRNTAGCGSRAAGRGQAAPRDRADADGVASPARRRSSHGNDDLPRCVRDSGGGDAPIRFLGSRRRVAVGRDSAAAGAVPGRLAERPELFRQPRLAADAGHLARCTALCARRRAGIVVVAPAADARRVRARPRHNLPAAVPGQQESLLQLLLPRDRAADGGCGGWECGIGR